MNCEEGINMETKYTILCKMLDYCDKCKGIAEKTLDDEIKRQNSVVLGIWNRKVELYRDEIPKFIADFNKYLQWNKG